MALDLYVPLRVLIEPQQVKAARERVPGVGRKV